MVLSGFRRNQCARRVRVDAATPRRAETMGRKRRKSANQILALERRPGPGRLELELGSFCCGFGSLRIDEEAVANDKRILAHVSWGEARTYIRGVNAHHEKGTRRYRMLMRGCLACFLLGAALFGTLMGVFHEIPRLRCKERLCELGDTVKQVWKKIESLEGGSGSSCDTSTSVYEVTVDSCQCAEAATPVEVKADVAEE